MPRRLESQLWTAVGVTGDEAVTEDEGVTVAAGEVAQEGQAEVGGAEGTGKETYRKVSNIRCTKSQNLNISRLIL